MCLPLCRSHVFKLSSISAPSDKPPYLYRTASKILRLVQRICKRNIEISALTRTKEYEHHEIRVNILGHTALFVNICHLSKYFYVMNVIVLCVPASSLARKMFLKVDHPNIVVINLGLKLIKTVI